MHRTGSVLETTRAPPTGGLRVRLPAIASSLPRWQPAFPCGCRGVSGATALDAAVATSCGGYGDVPGQAVVGERATHVKQRVNSFVSKPS